MLHSILRFAVVAVAVVSSLLALFSSIKHTHTHTHLLHFFWLHSCGAHLARTHTPNQWHIISVSIDDCLPRVGTFGSISGTALLRCVHYSMNKHLCGSPASCNAYKRFWAHKPPGKRVRVHCIFGRIIQFFSFDLSLLAFYRRPYNMSLCGVARVHIIKSSISVLRKNLWTHTRKGSRKVLGWAACH